MDAYIYQKQDWPNFKWDNEHLISLLGKVRNLQGHLIGSMEILGFDLRDEASLAILTQDVLKTTEIEGEILNPDQVRSSLAQRLGMDTGGLVPSSRDVDGIVDMMLDAVQNNTEKLTKERLCDWHFSLFPTRKSGLKKYKIIVGDYRQDRKGRMQVVSGGIGKETIHFEAPKATEIEKEMNVFLDWFNEENHIDPVLKAGIAHFWFITIHPFEDGNGRMARAITDMLLARADGISQRFYSMSSQIQLERMGYYSILENTQKGILDITNWLDWFLTCLMNALKSSDELLAKVLDKHKFWVKYSELILNERQVLMLNKLLDGFAGKLTSTKWAKICKCSPDTSLRDIKDLIDKQILRKEKSGGRSTSYELIKI